MAVDVKLLHIVSENNLIKLVHRFVLSDESVPVSRSENESSADPSCLKSKLNI